MVFLHHGYGKLYLAIKREDNGAWLKVSDILACVQVEASQRRSP